MCISSISRICSQHKFRGFVVALTNTVTTSGGWQILESERLLFLETAKTRDSSKLLPCPRVAVDRWIARRFHGTCEEQVLQLTRCCS
uniref:Uncharacterized protein n=1 Tax=Physcomitrium patens TaxID=3218 RepID=A0A2K1JEC9_PHYPA|nr:hypothetical protein PHYPA_020173 [Physcomitrium patens]